MTIGGQYRLIVMVVMTIEGTTIIVFILFVFIVDIYDVILTFVVLPFIVHYLYLMTFPGDTYSLPTFILVFSDDDDGDAIPIRDYYHSRIYSIVDPCWYSVTWPQLTILWPFILLIDDYGIYSLNGILRFIVQPSSIQYNYLTYGIHLFQ